jgi:hypothetical protein
MSREQLTERIKEYGLACRRSGAASRMGLPEAVALEEESDAAFRALTSDVSALLSDLDRSRTELAALRRGIAVVLDRAARGENVVAALAALVR